MPNGRTLLKPLGRSDGAPRLVSTPFDHFPSEMDPPGLTIPPVTTPSLLRAMVSGVVKGSVVTPYRSAEGESGAVSVRARNAPES